MLSARLNKEEVIRTYTANAGVYDLWAWLTEGRARRQAVEYAAVRDGEEILEVAVGTGLTFYELVQRNPSGRNQGIDLTPAMVARSRARVADLPARVDVQEGDAGNLPFADHSFDLLVNNYMFDLLPEERFVPQLQEFKRVLRPDGRLVITNMARARHFWQGVYEWVYRLSPGLMGGCRGVVLDEALQAAGFQVERRRYLSQFGFPSEVLLARSQ